MSTETYSHLSALLDSIFHNAIALNELHNLPEISALAFLAQSASEKLEAEYAKR